MPDQDAFLAGFLKAALWAEHADDTDKSFSDVGAEFSPAAIEKIRADCEAFQKLAAPELARAAANGRQTIESLGSDFYFTRCGHGCGYWDRGDDVGDQLTEKARTFKSLDLYLSDAGEVEVM